MERVLVARTMIVRPDGKILVLQRSSHDEDSPSRVDFPGGGVEPGELPQSAAAREIREETGLAVVDDDLMLGYTFTRYKQEANDVVIRFLYVVHVQDVHILISPEHEKYWWSESNEVMRQFAGISWHEAIQFVLKHNMLL